MNWEAKFKRESTKRKDAEAKLKDEEERHMKLRKERHKWDDELQDLEASLKSMAEAVTKLRARISGWKS